MFQFIPAVIVARVWVTRMGRGSPVRGHFIFWGRVQISAVGNHGADALRGLSQRVVEQMAVSGRRLGLSMAEKGTDDW